jgi:hypothetical protein
MRSQGLNGDKRRKSIHVLPDLLRHQLHLASFFNDPSDNDRRVSEVLMFLKSFEPLTRGTYSGAFVIRFGEQTNLSANVVEGRVEHVVSGNILHFQSLPQLLAFMDRVLKESSVSIGSA